MPTYKVGAIFSRCFIQKRIEPRDGVTVIPLGATGSSGDIHTARRLLEMAGFPFSRRDLEKTLANFQQAGHSVLVNMVVVDARSFQDAIDIAVRDIDPIAGALSVISGNPVVPLCIFAQSGSDSGVKFYVPNDRIIRHGTNIAGFLDVLPDLAKAAHGNDKLALLLRLYRASLRETEVDHQILFQLVLLEEASDNEPGGTFAERLRHFTEAHELTADFEYVAKDLQFPLPQGKDVVDVLVKLRNAAAHNGKIDAEALCEYKGEWLIPLIGDKQRLHKLVGEAIRYMFCCLVGHSRDKKATLIQATKPNEVFTVRFD